LRTCETLKERGLSQDSFEVMFACYRNYDCGKAMILQNSPWESKPENLKLFLDKISASGGICEEAVEIGL